MMEIKVDINSQTMTVFQGKNIVKKYLVSTAKNGPGEKRDSEQTPRGRHIIRAKIGADMPPNTVFRGRRPTGEKYECGLREQYPDRDWILTRIMWLSGQEPGRNRLGDVDTMRRYIYIHGSPDDVEMGKPGSRGCIRMRNTDIIELFDMISAGTTITIE